MREELNSVTPELADVIDTAIDARLMDLNICLPAKIVSYDATTQYADVEIQLLQKYEGDSAPMKCPVIPNVPVKHPRANNGQAYVHMPLVKGDDVTLVFSQRSLDNWKTQGGLSDPADRRKFHLTDAFALIGGSAQPDAFEVNDPKSIEIQNSTGRLQIKPDGTINIGDFAPTKSVALAEAVEARLEAIEEGIQTLISSINTNVSLEATHTHIVTSPGNPSGPPVPFETPVGPFTPDTSVVASQKAKVVP